MAICCYRRSVSPTAELQSVRAYTISPVTTAPRSKHVIYDNFGEGPRRKEEHEEEEEEGNWWGNDGGGSGGTHGNGILRDGGHQQKKENLPPEVKEFVTDLYQNGVIQPLLTDLYQITMAYAYWKSGKKDETSVFDLFFRRNPFKGEFCLFAGLEECLKFLKNFHYSSQDIDYLRTVLPETTEEEFFEYLQNLTTDGVTVMAIDEGSVVFPKVPLLRLEGPLAVVQLLETTLLTLVNFASLVATNAARFRIAAGQDKSLLEFGLRRSQGPDGGLSASRYCYLGGFDGTSNVLAGKLYGIPVKGTHAHAYVTSYTSLHDLRRRELKSEWGVTIDLVKLSTDWLEKVGHVLGVGSNDTNQGELAAFIAYALAFPAAFLALVDTYDVLRSGIPNFCAVAMALGDMGYRSQGVRIDSGDLAYLSLETRDCFRKVARAFKRDWFEDMMIVGSNDINEGTIHSLNEKANAGNRSKGHSIDCFGIGTHLVTCQAQPALGCVFKLVEINGIPRIKLSQDVGKVTIPGKKVAYRLYSSDGTALSDLLLQPDEDPPEPGKRILCRHPFQESKRVNIVPARVEALYKVYYKHGQIQQDLPVLRDLRQKALESLKCIRLDQKRNLNPTPYKVSVTDKLYNFIHELWLSNAPIGELA